MSVYKYLIFSGCRIFSISVRPWFLACPLKKNLIFLLYLFHLNPHNNLHLLASLVHLYRHPNTQLQSMSKVHFAITHFDFLDIFSLQISTNLLAPLKAQGLVVQT